VEIYSVSPAVRESLRRRAAVAFEGKKGKAEKGIEFYINGPWFFFFLPFARLD